MINRNFLFWVVAIVIGSVINAGFFFVLPSLGQSEPVAEPDIVTVELSRWQQPVAKPVIEKKQITKPKKVPKKKPKKKIKLKQKLKPIKKPEPKIVKTPKPIKKPVLTEQSLPLAPPPKIEAPEVVEKIPEPQPDNVIEKDAVPEDDLPIPVPIFKLSSMPRFIHQSKPVYPLSMREQGREAVVKLEILLDVKGQVRKVTVIRSGGILFDQAAIDSIKQSNFSAGKINGKSVSVLLKKTIRFRIR